MSLPAQFVISKGDVDAPESWLHEEKAGWNIWHHAAAGVSEMDGGWLIGQPTHKGEMVNGNPPEDLYEMGGPWAAICLDEERVYTDGCGHLSLVYGHGRVASNPELIPSERNEELVQLMSIPEEDNWYPFGLTPKRGVKRLLPNHFLDLESWTTHRHWPDQTLADTLSLDEVARIVAARTKENIQAVGRGHPLELLLTSGYDSRLLLACSRDQLKNLTCFTHDGHPSTGELDVLTAAKLCQRYFLKHNVVRDIEATQKQKDAWLKRAGYSAAGAGYHTAGSSHHYSDERVKLKGHLGGSVRVIYEKKVKADEPISAEKLLDILGLPINQEVKEAAQQWLDGLSGKQPNAILDLLYIEQRMACWAGVHRWGNIKPHLMFWPLAHRDIVEAAMRLPTKFKEGNAVHLKVIENEWPELFDIPLNEWWGARKLKRDAFRQINRLTEKLAIRSRVKRWFG